MQLGYCPLEDKWFRGENLNVEHPDFHVGFTTTNLDTQPSAVERIKLALSRHNVKAEPRAVLHIPTTLPPGAP